MRKRDEEQRRLRKKDYARKQKLRGFVLNKKRQKKKD